MKFKRLVMGAAVAGALSAGSAVAGITGVPGEALLVPLFMNSDRGTADVQAETYVALYVPTAIGRDTVFDYTAPNTQGQTQVLTDSRIYWKTFNRRSEPGPSGVCEVSPGDKVVWTTDLTTYRAAQTAQDNGLSIMGNPPPLSVCGPGQSLDRAGYVVFQSYEGARGQVADFAFWGNAWIAENVLTQRGTTGAMVNLAAVPVIPMADGPDGVANATPSMANQVTMTSPINDPTPPTDGPFDVRPLAAGIRLSGPVGATDVVLHGELRGPFTNSEQGLHVFWFDQNLDRAIGVNIWDDQQGVIDDGVDLSDELNLIMWNHAATVAANTGASWNNMAAGGGWNTNERYTYVLDAVAGTTNAGPLNSPFYSAPPFWNAGNPTAGYPGALNGYVEYFLDVEDGHTAVAFQWQELQGVGSGGRSSPVTGTNDTAWSTHLITDLGKR